MELHLLASRFNLTNNVGFIIDFVGSQEGEFNCIRVPQYYKVEKIRCLRQPDPGRVKRPCNMLPCPPRFVENSCKLTPIYSESQNNISANRHVRSNVSIAEE